MTFVIEYIHALTNAFCNGFGFGATVVGICLQLLAFFFGLAALIGTVIVAFSILQLCGIRALWYARPSMLPVEERALRALDQAKSAIIQFRKHVADMITAEMYAQREGKTAEPSASSAAALERAMGLLDTAITMVKKQQFTEALEPCIQISALCGVEEDGPPSLLELIVRNCTAIDQFLIAAAC